MIRRELSVLTIAHRSSTLTKGAHQPLRWFARSAATNYNKDDMADTTVQYVVVRSDLLDSLKWPLGAVIAQACHASTAALHRFRDDAHTKEYMDKLESMHKVVLACPSETELRALESKLNASSICHTLWMEQPEDIATALATKPYPRTEVAPFFKHLKLYK